MNPKKFISALYVLTVATAAATMVACGRTSHSATSEPAKAVNIDKPNKSGGPQLGQRGGGPAIDKSEDAHLQAMIKELVPKFKEAVYTDKQTGKTLKYSIFTPTNIEAGKKYPLVLFMADASTPGNDYAVPLIQGYGALVLAADGWQSEHSCYVLVPQFSGVAVNDAFEHTDEVDMVIRLVEAVCEGDDSIDENRLYTTGQSMGGMISMYYNIAYPDVFAASLFVDSHWDTSKFDELVKHKFVYVTAGTSGHAWGDIKPLEEAAEKEGIEYEYERWSAKLPQSEQDSLASAMLAKGAPVNVINFAPRSVLPEDGKGSEHMYSFDYAYKLTPVLEWVFRQTK